MSSSTGFPAGAVATIPSTEEFGLAKAFDMDFVEANNLFRFPTEFPFNSASWLLFGTSAGGEEGRVVGKMSLLETCVICIYI